MIRRIWGKPRRRRSKAQKRRNWKLVWRAFQIAFAFALIGGITYAVYSYLTESDRYKVATVRIAGANVLEESEILRLANITDEDALINVDIRGIARKIEDMPYVKTCKVIRRMPDIILIEIEERIPVAALMVNNRLYELDREGVVLREIDSLAPHPGPMITSLPELNFTEPGQTIAQEELFMALSLWDAFSKHTVAAKITVSELAAPSTEHISMICNELPFEIRWGYSDVNDQADKFNTLWHAQDGNFPCQQYLDLRFGADIPCL